MENNSILEKVNELKNTYYSDNGKNILFKNKQKFECANNIINSIGIDDLIRKTIYIIQDTNNVYIDYTLFKLFATPEQYNRIVDYAISAINFSINKYGSYEVHINLDTFTVSAAERYKHIIIIFLNECIQYDGKCSELLTKMHIHNTPKTFNLISKILLPLMDPLVKSKLILHEKN
jgi:hypothetical protein